MAADVVMPKHKSQQISRDSVISVLTIEAGRFPDLPCHGRCPKSPFCLVRHFTTES